MAPIMPRRLACFLASVGWLDLFVHHASAGNVSVSLAVSANSADYDDSVAHVFADLAETSYCGPMDKMASWTCEPCVRSGVKVVPGSWRYVHHQEAITPNATYVLVAKLDGPPPFVDGCLVSVRGTELLANLMPDAMFERWSLPPSWKCRGCAVSEGWFRTWIDIEKKVVDLLGEIGCTPGGGNGLFITGHSMGAAVATVATFSLKQNFNFDVRMAVVFASPRVGNERFAERFDALAAESFPFYRVTHNRDPIVHLPPPMLGFQHVRQEVFYEVAGGARRICEGLFDPHCSSGVHLFDISDHCGSPFRRNESLCDCPGWITSGTVSI